MDDFDPFDPPPGGRAPVEYHWHYDSELKRDTPPPIVLAFLDHLVAVPPDGLTDKAWAEAAGVDPRTVRRWKADPRFRELWQEAADGSIMGPDALGPLYRSALKIIADPDHPKWGDASKIILNLNNKITPPEVNVTVRPEERFEGMSDEELAAFLGAAAAQDVHADS